MVVLRAVRQRDIEVPRGASDERLAVVDSAGRGIATATLLMRPTRSPVVGRPGRSTVGYPAADSRQYEANRTDERQIFLFRSAAGSEEHAELATMHLLGPEDADARVELRCLV